MPAYCLPAILPLVEKEWAITHGAAGLMVAAFQAGYIAAALVALPLTDRFDARWIITGGAVLSAVTHFFFPLLAGNALSGTLLRALAGAILLFCLTKIKAGQKHLPGLPAAESPKLGKA